ncbi:MAG: thioredoxin domain-containing protein, partial [Planctomycetales bacterium]|nr:thioredoxin domain-containing protein [Planctomycetales bacterium]
QPESSEADPVVSSSESQHTNRLAQETSPYLRLHMHNPVNWYPWGPEALAKAKQENKMIFLSVGYSSCYWCHVMERESFMDEEIAKFLNDHFICIKVDREERPDVDAIYMMSVQLMSGRGGWPMSVFLTPDARPFFGGTYFPARDGDRPGSPGFLTVLRKINDSWTSQREKLTEVAAQVTGLIQSELGGKAADATTQLDVKLLEQITTSLATQFDDLHGGFGFQADDPNRPKFPEASRLWYLLDRAEQADDAECRRMLNVTLQHMLRGGIYDHVGGGFHRYSTDRFWRVPHFEKMLYDNGQLLSVYSRAYKLTGDTAYRDVVTGIVECLNRDMRDAGGAFYSALDAESEHVEGKFYRWTKEEVSETLGADSMAIYAAAYGLDGPANFEEFYVPQLSQPLSEIAQSLGIEEGDLRKQLAAMNAKLLAVRNQRVRPLTDTKILCSWNGLAIRGLADAGRLCDAPEYTEAAVAAAEFVLKNLRDADGKLLRTYSEGAAKLTAYVDDYAFLVDGLIALHQATNDDRWLKVADELTSQQLAQYWDDDQGAFFFTANNHEALIVRNKQLVDEAQPAGNSVAAANLVYLADKANHPEYLDRAAQIVRNMLPVAERYVAVAPRLALQIPVLSAAGR